VLKETVAVLNRLHCKLLVHSCFPYDSLFHWLMNSLGVKLKYLIIMLIYLFLFIIQKYKEKADKLNEERYF